MMFEREVENYIAQLNKSKNTCESYRRALRQMCEFLYVRAKTKANKSKKADATVYSEEKLIIAIADFINELRTTKSPATVTQVISILKGFFDYEISNRLMQTNPLAEIEPPKLEKKPKREFTFTQIPQGYAAKAVRDRAMITVLNETGMKVSELLGLRVRDVKELAISSEASEILYDYIYATRPEIVGDASTDLLFPNMDGRAMSRQGFWKNMHAYEET